MQFKTEIYSVSSEQYIYPHQPKIHSQIKFREIISNNEHTNYRN